MPNKKALEFAKITTAKKPTPKASSAQPDPTAVTAAASKFVGKNINADPMRGIAKRPNFKSFIFKPPRGG